MKKLILFILTVFTLAASLVAAGCGGSGEKSAAGGEKILRAGCTGQSYPNSYVENGKLTGYDVEIIETAAKNLGYKVQWTTIDFQGLIGQLDAQKLDVVANDVSITEARKEKYYFSEPYSYTGTQFVVRKESSVQSVEDLYGKTTAAVAGSMHLKTVQKAFPSDKIKIRAYETRDGAQNDLLNGRVDAYVNSRVNLIAQIKKGNLLLRLVGDAINPRPSAYPFNKAAPGGAKLAEEFSKELVRMRGDGTLKRLAEKYYGVDVSADPAKK